MRRLEIVFGSGAVVIAVSLVPVGGCSASDSHVNASGGSAGESGGTGGGPLSFGGQVSLGGRGGAGGDQPWWLQHGAGPGSAGGAGGASGAGGAGGAGSPGDGTYPFGGVASSETCWAPTRFWVQLPPEGTPARPEDLCAAESPVDSGWAARVTLVATPDDARTARGQVTLNPALVGHTQGLPRISVLERSATLGTALVENVVTSTDGFAFDLTLSSAPLLSDYLVVDVEIDMACDGDAGAPRTVHAQTAIYLCGDYSGTAWISSGDECVECAPVCEMAPSPVPHAASEERLALGGAVRARVRIAARVRDAVVLTAEHDAGADRMRYEWHVSAGELVWTERDVALWRPPADLEEHLVQVAVSGEDRAAVASLRLRARGAEA